MKREEIIMENIKYILDEKEIPQYWYNILADLPEPLPQALHPGTKEPLKPEDLKKRCCLYSGGQYQSLV